MSLSLKRTLYALLAVAAVALALPLLSASPAQAAAAECESYLADRGYEISAGVRDGCEAGETSFSQCQSHLGAAGVAQFDQRHACNDASQPTVTCESYLSDNGYPAGELIVRGCGSPSFSECLDYLDRAGVSAFHQRHACNYAGQR
ncbi:hypothetical protein [Salininema proteolyticum]|uniref:Uncharacterized protein n=1 Tax=Salininema proteolyticum TaxID=1607685 RepID=A0ABV8U607_9ACTN